MKIRKILLFVLCVSFIGGMCNYNILAIENQPEHIHSYSYVDKNDGTHDKKCDCMEVAENESHFLIEGNCVCGFNGVERCENNESEQYSIECVDGNHVFTPIQYNFIKGFWSYTGDWQAMARKHTYEELIIVCEMEGHIYGEGELPNNYTVKFGYYDENGILLVIKEEVVDRGGNATPPINVPRVDNKEYIMWFGDYTNITSNRTIIALYEDVSNSPYGIVCADGYHEFTPTQYMFIKGFWTYTGDWQGMARKHTYEELILVCKIEGHIYEEGGVPNNYTVKFGYYDECGILQILKEEVVDGGGSATPPTNVPRVDNKEYIMWLGDYTNITSNRTIIALYEGVSDSPYGIICADGYHEFTSRQYNFIKCFWTYTGDWQGMARKHTYEELILVCEVEGHIYENEYMVTFGYYDENNVFRILKVEAVARNFDAMPPTTVPSIVGKEFIGWDGTYSKVTSDRTIYAKYKSISTTSDQKKEQDNSKEEHYVETTNDSRIINTEITVASSKNEMFPTGVPDGSQIAIKKTELINDNSVSARMQETSYDDGVVIDNKLLEKDVTGDVFENTIDDTLDNFINKSMSDETKANIISEINQTAEGNAVIVDMKNATIIPREILLETKGKNIDIVLDMGDYSWTINGKDISTFNINDIDLEVTFDNDIIPKEKISQLAGGNQVKKITLTYHGDFGFSAKLQINLGTENSGKYGNLYYYDDNGDMKYQNAGIIEENGYVQLIFTHASEYLVVIADEDMRNIESSVDTTRKINKSFETKYYWSIILALLLIVGSFFYGRKRNN